MSPFLILVVIALLCFVVALVWPSPYLTPVGGIFLAVAELIAHRGG